MDTRRLKKLMKTQRKDMAAAAAALGISKSTLHRRFRQGMFRSEEIHQWIAFLKITNPEEIFLFNV